MNKHVQIDELSTSATTTDRIDAALLRLRSIGAILRQLGSTQWTGIDNELPNAIAVIGTDLCPVVDLLEDISPELGKAPDGPIEALHKEYTGRSAVFDLMPDHESESRVEWLREPVESAVTTHPSSAREWAAKVMLMTLGGTTLETDAYLESLIADARATLGIRAGDAS